MNGHRLLITILSALLLTFALSCDKTTTGPGDGEDDGQPPHPFDAYPHPDDAEWLMDDNNGGWRFLLDGTSTHNTAGEVQNLESYWSYNYEDWEHDETEYVYVSETEVRLYFDLQAPFYDTWLKFPLNEGDNWVYRTEGDNDYEATVLAIEDVTVRAGTFEDCYKIKYEYSAGINDWSFTIWHHWAVGGKYGVKASFVNSENDWELYSYNLPSC